MRPSLRRGIFHRLVHDKRAIISGSIALLLIVTALLAPFIAPQHYAEGNFQDTYEKPNSKYWLGTDFMGRDILSRLIYGARISLAVGFLGALSSLIIGLSFGTISGVYGGVVDTVMMRFVDVVYAFPALLFIILLMVVFKSGVSAESSNVVVVVLNRIDASLGGVFFILVGISTVTWVGMARTARGMSLAVREEEYIEAARAIGNSKLRIVLKHVMPNVIGPCVIRATMQIPRFISTEAFLSFLGIGVTPPTPSWGLMIAAGYPAMRSYPHLIVFAGLALAVTMLAFNFLGDALRDAIDVQMR